MARSVGDPRAERTRFRIIADGSSRRTAPRATELIAEAALGRLLQTTPNEIALRVHPHPTVSEVVGEAGHDLLRQRIHT